MAAQRIAYLECSSGICGSMLLGALIDAGADEVSLREHLQKLNIDNVEMRISVHMEKNLKSRLVKIKATADHHHRGLGDIREIIEKSELNNNIKNISLSVFERLAQAEAQIHNTSVDRVHFHEVGAVDAIYDIVGVAIALDLLQIKAVYASSVNTGEGSVNAAHGVLPIPAPATLLLLKGVPLYSNGVQAELTTPTGAALLNVLSHGYGSAPPMQVQSIGYGAGEHELPFPNLLRIRIGNRVEITRNDSNFGSRINGEQVNQSMMKQMTPDYPYNQDQIIVLKCNLDDITPEHIGYLIEMLNKQEALDVFTTAIQMKKNRPGVQITVLCYPDFAERIERILFEHSSTFGVRKTIAQRSVLVRELRTIATEFGEIQCKIGYSGDRIVRIAPEYESCRQKALDQNVPLQWVYRAAEAAAEEYRKSPDRTEP
ncbi:MAG: nickel pincer cofactor biosynthesis protein LarC [Leptospiraceae bacterium]|nr:nickel pincer cofactor biosynthesis protein LarC [Leptospiraceae bacterium]